MSDDRARIDAVPVARIHGAPVTIALVTGEDGLQRCAWSSSDSEYRRYHDEEWGVPLHGDRPLFEKLSLEGFQAGLSWLTILRRRPGFREVFHNFEIDKVAAMTPADAEKLMHEPRIIRNRAKIEATISNARIAAELISGAGRSGALDELLWSFAPPARAKRLTHMDEIPAVSEESAAMSKALRSRGFKFVGPTTMYALIQSAGMVDDHLQGCWRAS